MSLFALKHPIAAHHLARLRGKETGPAEFRACVRRLAALLAVEAARDLPLERIEVETPVARTAGWRLGQRLGLAPVLRAGLGMVEPILDFFPDSEVWHLGFYRDEKTLKPVEYYRKLPAGRASDVVFVLDPMLATGGSIAAVLGALRDWGVPKLKVLSLIAAPEGVAVVQNAFPDVDIHVAAVDESLNEHGFILPGLGDAGDRTFNTR